jgi:hypothetical protein
MLCSHADFVSEMPGWLHSKFMARPFSFAQSYAGANFRAKVANVFEAKSQSTLEDS